jgi:DNA repair protein RecN (Recombination protein N)
MRLAAVQERRAELARLIRTYGSAGPAAPPPANAADPAEEQQADRDQADARTGPPIPDLSAVLRWAKLAQARLLELDGADDKISGLTSEVAELDATVHELAERLSAARTQVAEQFGAEVTAELTDLAMPHARLTVAVSQLSEPGPHGADDVEIRLSAHPGAPSLPLQKGASGGELSRAMLAIEVVFAGANPVPTFVFDEVDAGVGGKAAVEVGKRLARLARRAQVIVVTHLPQVAAFADTHLVIEKADDGSVIRSGLTLLDEAGRVRELSRMLAGLEDSEHGQAHAGELLATAARERQGAGEAG